LSSRKAVSSYFGKDDAPNRSMGHYVLEAMFDHREYPQSHFRVRGLPRASKRLFGGSWATSALVRALAAVVATAVFLTLTLWAAVWLVLKLL
jgi:hypothetical protein